MGRAVDAGELISARARVAVSQFVYGSDVIIRRLLVAGAALLGLVSGCDQIWVAATGDVDAPLLEAEDGSPADQRLDVYYYANIPVPGRSFESVISALGD